MRPVHPRVCGERPIRLAEAALYAGSSPRVRGTLKVDQRVLPAVRFIPACAGNARMRLLMGSNHPVHPRVCGERNGRQPIGAPLAG